MGTRHNLSIQDPCNFSIDGEPDQLQNVMLLKSHFKQMNTMIAKHAASLSKFSNALDAGNIHKASKTKQRHMTDERAFHGKESVLANLELIVRVLRPNLTADRRHLICKSAVRISVAFQSTLCQDMILHSFEKAAQTLPPSLESKLCLFPGNRLKLVNRYDLSCIIHR